jgi:hypothetical protein
MPLCIFCRNERELTEEHIVPDCVGGSLKPKLLCKECNSTLGSTIDGPFSNTVLVQLARQSYQIPGKGGTVPNPFGSYGATTHEGRELSIRLDEQFKPYFKPIVTEQRTDQGLEISISIDKKDEGDIESILRKKITRYCRSLGMPDDEIQTKVAQAVQDAKKIAVTVSHQPTVKYSFSIDINVLVLESIKIAYEIAALEFGDMYVTCSPAAEVLRCALQHQRLDGIAGGFGIDLDSLKAILPGQDAHYVLLLHNSCVVSIFGIATIIKYCGEQEAFARSIDDAVLYFFDPVNRSHVRHLLDDFLFQHVNGKA